MGIMAPMMGAGDDIKVYQPINVYRVFVKTTDTPSAHKYIKCKAGDVFLVANNNTGLSIVSDKGVNSFVDVRASITAENYYSHIIPQLFRIWHYDYAQIYIVRDCTLDISFIKASPTDNDSNVDFYHIRALSFDGLDNVQTFQGYSQYSLLKNHGNSVNVSNVPDGYYRVLQVYYISSTAVPNNYAVVDNTENIILGKRAGNSDRSISLWLTEASDGKSGGGMETTLPFGYALRPYSDGGASFSFLEHGRNYTLYNLNTYNDGTLFYKDFKIID